MLTRVDFRALARTVADQIFAERSCHLLREHDDLEEAAAFESRGDIPPYWDPTQPLQPVIVSILNRPHSFLAALKEGAQFGGTEFLNLIIQSCEEISSRAQGNLPPPVDPSSL